MSQVRICTQLLKTYFVWALRQWHTVTICLNCACPNFLICLLQIEEMNFSTLLGLERRYVSLLLLGNTSITTLCTVFIE